MLTRVAPREIAAPSMLIAAGPGTTSLNLLGGGQPNSAEASRCFLDQLDERPVCGPRVEERDLPPVCPGPRHAVHELEPFPLQASQLDHDVLHRERHVVQALAPLLQEASQRALLSE